MIGYIIRYIGVWEMLDGLPNANPSSTIQAIFAVVWLGKLKMGKRQYIPSFANNDYTLPGLWHTIVGHVYLVDGYFISQLFEVISYHLDDTPLPKAQNTLDILRKEELWPLCIYHLAKEPIKLITFIIYRTPEIRHREALTWKSPYDYVTYWQLADIYPPNVCLNNIISNIVSVGACCIMVDVVCPYDMVTCLYKAQV